MEGEAQLWELSILLLRGFFGTTSTVSDQRDLALVIGDSHVYWLWLGRFMSNSMLRFGSGPDFLGDNCRIRFIGFWGGSIDSLGQVTSLLAAGVVCVYLNSRSHW